MNGQGRNRRTGMGWLMGVLALATVGCHSAPSGTAIRYDNARFMDGWTTYTHCLSAGDAQSALNDAQKLQDLSRTQQAEHSLSQMLPDQLKQVVTQPSARTAVDVYAMAAACSLHTGDLAMASGESDLARMQFQQILESRTHADHDYYAAQARTRLTNLELALHAALR